MNKYAMVNKNIVIEIVESEIAPVWPNRADGSAFLPIACNESVGVGMVYDPVNGSFKIPVIVEREKTLSQLDRIEAQVNTIANGATENADAINILLGVSE